MTSEATWMEEARELAAQCWCDKETQNQELDTSLAEAIAKRIAAWMETAAQNQRNADYYRGLLERCGQALGDIAYLQDDGGRSEDVLCAKIPEIIEADNKVVKRFGIDFDSEGGALTLGGEEVTDQASATPGTYTRTHQDGWVITGVLKEDYYEWVNDFSAFHPELGWVVGNFEDSVIASSEAAFVNFYENHTPNAWDYYDI